MERGFVKLWRCSLDSLVWNNDGLWKAWCWCLMKASYKERWEKIQTGKGWTEVHLLPGQFIFGRLSAANACQTEQSNIRNRIEKLKRAGNIDIKPDTHFSIITIRNWETYQGEESEEGRAIGQAKDRQRTTKGHKQEGKALKNEKIKDKKEDFDPFLARPDFISEKSWSDVIIHRRKKKAAETERAYTAIINEFENAMSLGFSIEKCIDTMTQRNWTGFEANWMLNDVKKGNGNKNNVVDEKSARAKFLLGGMKDDIEGSFGVGLPMGPDIPRQQGAGPTQRNNGGVR